MSPRTYALALSAVALLLKFEGGDSFVQPGAVSVRSQSSNVIMSKTIMSVHDVRPVERRTFVTTLISGGLVGASGLGLAMERAEAYEQEYLKEPTEEFKAMEARQTEFAKVQRAYKQDFVKRLDAFLAVETDADAVVTLNAISTLVSQRRGLPESVRINDLLKTCRRKKGEMKDSGKWGTPVQIAYETLVQVTNKSVVPLQSGG